SEPRAPPLSQVQQKDVGRRLQVGQELLEYLRDPAASPDVEQDPQRLDRVIDELAAWVNSSNFKFVLALFFFFLFFSTVCNCHWSALPSSGGGVDL
uniref:CLIP-associating protein 1 n=1 Tax=Anser cygnoides TaxID=8845 RepID=A0A8B9IND7_ANSCY